MSFKTMFNCTTCRGADSCTLNSHFIKEAKTNCLYLLEGLERNICRVYFKCFVNPTGLRGCNLFSSKLFHLTFCNNKTRNFMFLLKPQLRCEVDTLDSVDKNMLYLASSYFITA